MRATLWETPVPISELAEQEYSPLSAAVPFLMVNRNLESESESDTISEYFSPSISSSCWLWNQTTETLAGLLETWHSRLSSSPCRRVTFSGEIVTRGESESSILIIHNGLPP